jgi:hypothetical protein
MGALFDAADYRADVTESFNHWADSRTRLMIAYESAGWLMVD